MKPVRNMMIAAALSVSIASTAIGATNFTDVPASHWGYTSIVNLAEKNIITGNSAGQYNPNEALDKFAASKILAQVAGYKYINQTEEEKRYYELSYQTNQPILSQYRKNFTKWDTKSEREIAFLLQKGIIKEVGDLGQFVLRMTDGTERVPVLTKEELCVFLVRLMGKEEEAMSSVASDLFNDDKDISAKAKPHVYYLKKAGVIQGGTTNLFQPKTNVTKAIMAVMVDKTMQVMEGQNVKVPNNTPPTVITPTTPSTSDTNQGVVQLETVEGKIENTYPTLTPKILQINTSFYRMVSTAKVYIDEQLKTFEDIKNGMEVVGVLQNGDLLEVRAKSILEIDTPIQTPVQDLPMETTELEGVVSKVTVNPKSGEVSVDIEVQIINPWGEIIKQVKSYTVDLNCKISRGDKVAGAADIAVGDIVKAEIAGSKIYEILLVEKDQEFIGMLIGRKYINNRTILVVQTEDGKEREFQVTDTTKFYKRGFNEPKVDKIRIGDKLTIMTEYDRLVHVAAEGVRSAKEGKIAEVVIGRQPKLTLELENGVIKTYEILPTVTIGSQGADIYSLRLGHRVRVELDSEEIEGITILNTTELQNVTAVIENMYLSSNYIIVREKTVYYGEVLRQIQTSSSTVVIDAQTGNRIVLSDLKVGMSVLITLEPQTGFNRAKTISILSR